MIDEKKWKEEYIGLCLGFHGMTEREAKKHFEEAPDFDYGYSPLWYIKEELNCEYLKKH